jgi:hypothetical protein
MGKLTGNASSYLEAVKATASDPIEYARAYGQVVGQIDALATTEAEAQTARVVSEISALKSDTLSALSALDARLLTTSTSLETRLSDMTALIEGLKSQVKTLETLDNSTTLTLMDMAARKLETDSLIETIASTSQSMIDAINALDIQLTQVTNVSYPSASVPGFAAGGSHLGGLRLVGERGPELEYTGPSHITPNHGIAGAFAEGNREMIVELSALREEVKDLRLEQRRQHHESARYQRDTADTLVKIDQVGIKTTAEA